MALCLCGAIEIGDIGLSELKLLAQDRRGKPTVRLEEQSRAGERNKRDHLPNGQDPSGTDMTVRIVVAPVTIYKTESLKPHPRDLNVGVTCSAERRGACNRRTHAVRALSGSRVVGDRVDAD
jgi:hypothetical protein